MCVLLSDVTVTKRKDELLVVIGRQLLIKLICEKKQPLETPCKKHICITKETKVP